MQTLLQLIPKVIAETTLLLIVIIRGGGGGRGVTVGGGGIGGKRTAFCKENSFVFKTEVLFQLVTLILITKAFFQSVG